MVEPPWPLWESVTEKLLQSSCEAICVVPAWSAGWVQKLVGCAHRRLYFERGVRMFEVFGKPAPNTLWGVWALWIKAGLRAPNNKDAIYRNCVFIPRWRPLGAMGVEESPNSNNFQIGK